MRASPTPCSSAWAARASARRSGRRRSARSRATRSSTFSTPPTRRRSRPSKTRSTSRARSSSWPASRARRSSRTSSRPTSSRRPGRCWAPRAGRRFVAITDPGSSLEKEAETDGFRHVFAGVKTIGGRYSALSNFGMVPAAVMGLDTERLLDEADRMLHACASRRSRRGEPRPRARARSSASSRARASTSSRSSPPRASTTSGPGSSSSSRSPPARKARASSPWTGSDSAAPGAYGEDRLFAYLRLDEAPTPPRTRRWTRSRRRDGRSCGSTWPPSTTSPRSSCAGRSPPRSPGPSWRSTPSTSPTSRRARSRPRALTAEYEKTGKLPSEAPFFEGEGIKLFADARNEKALRRGRRPLARRAS